MTLGEDAEELIPDREYQDGDDETVESLMEVLTVTSKKLQAMTQGRKFRAAPKRSIEDRKKTSACSACGQLGYWAGDKIPGQCKRQGQRRLQSIFFFQQTKEGDGCSESLFSSTLRRP